MSRFDILHKWVSDNDAAMAVFVPEDMETFYDELRYDDPDMPPWEEIGDRIIESKAWYRHIPDAMIDRGYEMFSDIVKETIAANRG